MITTFPPNTLRNNLPILTPFTGEMVPRSTAYPTRCYRLVCGRRVPVYGVTALLIGIVDKMGGAK